MRVRTAAQAVFKDACRKALVPRDPHTGESGGKRKREGAFEDDALQVPGLPPQELRVWRTLVEQNQLNGYTVGQLKEYLRAYALPLDGTKPKLMDRVGAHVREGEERDRRAAPMLPLGTPLGEPSSLRIGEVPVSGTQSSPAVMLQTPPTSYLSPPAAAAKPGHSQPSRPRPQQPNVPALLPVMPLLPPPQPPAAVPPLQPPPLV